MITFFNKLNISMSRNFIYFSNKKTSLIVKLVIFFFNIGLLKSYTIYKNTVKLNFLFIFNSLLYKKITLFFKNKLKFILNRKSLNFFKKNVNAILLLSTSKGVRSTLDSGVTGGNLLLLVCN